MNRETGFVRANTAVPARISARRAELPKSELAPAPAARHDFSAMSVLPQPGSLGEWLPQLKHLAPWGVAEAPIDLAPESSGSRAQVDARGVHLDPMALALPASQLDRLLAHEAAHCAQQAAGARPAAREDVELEAHGLAADFLAGRPMRPRRRAPRAWSLRDTPLDRLEVERARRQLPILERFVSEHFAREGRRMATRRERDPLLAARRQMDEQSADPMAAVDPQARARMEAANIAGLNRLPLNIEVTEDAIRFRVNFHVRFEDPAMASRFGELQTSVQTGIRLVWNQLLRGDAFGRRRFTIEPAFTQVSATASRNRNFWLITVRPVDTGPVNYGGCSLPQPDVDIPTSVTDATCDGGVMSIPPLHIARPGVLGHEMLHLFGLLDRYISISSVPPGGGRPQVQNAPTRPTSGRRDPLGTEEGTILAEDLTFLFDRLGVYEMEENRGLEALNRLERQGMTIGAVIGQINRLEEIIRLGRNPRRLFRPRTDFTDRMIRDAENL